MSRVILSKYDDGSNHVVVGWDHPAGGAFWQEYASKSEIADAEKWLEEHGEEDTDEALRMERVAETDIKRDGGMWPGIPLGDLRQSMPEELRPLMTDAVLELLSTHSEDPDSGYNRATALVDWTKRVH
jgi:hypothetical protein